MKRGLTDQRLTGMAIKSTSEAKRRKIRKISATKMEETRELIRIECPECKGEGIVYELDHDDECVSMTSYKEKECPTCKGVGFIYKEK